MFNVTQYTYYKIPIVSIGTYYLKKTKVIKYKCYYMGCLLILREYFRMLWVRKGRKPLLYSFDAQISNLFVKIQYIGTV